MMAHDPKQLSECDEVLNDAAIAKAMRARAETRRTQALLAAAGEMVPERRWAVITVDHRRDNDVDNLLSRAMIEHWLPLRKSTETIGGKRRGAPGQPVWMLAWQGYIFVKIADTAEAWQGIRSVKHVRSVLGSASSPIFFDDAKVLRLKAELATLKPSNGKPEVMVVEGDEVIVTDGPFTSFPGRVDGVGEGCNQGRARVEVMVFGRAVPVEIDLAQLAKRV